MTITGTRARAEDYGKDLGAFTYLPMTATDNDSLERLAGSISALDILINNVGGVLPDGKDEWQPEVFEKAVAINLTSHYRLVVTVRSCRYGAVLRACQMAIDADLNGVIANVGNGVGH